MKDEKETAEANVRWEKREKKEWEEGEKKLINCLKLLSKHLQQKKVLEENEEKN